MGAPGQLYRLGTCQSRHTTIADDWLQLHIQPQVLWALWLNSEDLGYVRAPILCLRA